MGLDQYASISHPISVNELQNVRERRIVLLHATASETPLHGSGLQTAEVNQPQGRVRY